MPVARRLLEILERADADLLVQPRDRLRTDALQAQHVEDGRRELLQQLLVVPDGARLHQLADLGGEVLADPRQREALRRRQPRDGLGFVDERLGRGAIRADLERVLVLDLEEIGNLLQHARDGQVIHSCLRRSQETRRPGDQEVFGVNRCDVAAGHPFTS
jgi:hypothetical protein